jgi:uncharacterized protein GlcG (DUF336 family)
MAVINKQHQRGSYAGVRVRSWAGQQLRGKHQMTLRLRGLSAMALVAMAGSVLAQQPPPGGPPNPKDPGNANGPPLGARPPDVVARSASIAVAVDLAKAIVVACEGYHVGISVLDAAGTPKLYYIPDGTGGTHAYTGYRKANTALSFKMPSGKVAAAAQADPAIAAKLTADANNYVTWAGGVLIMAGTEVIGAVGVSGAQPSAKDEACALEGLRKVQSRLK